MATLARIVEEEDVKILNAFITSQPGAENVELTLKFNRHDLSRVIASLERHGYEIKETFAETGHSEALKERYESFLHYLNI